jgi:hypothetical protein
VNTEFTANGKKVKGFADPDKIIAAQQMAHGFSEKMAGFKPYRPLLKALDESGMVNDPDKFNLAINIMNGDKEAIRQHIKNLNIDYEDLDVDNEIQYNNANHVVPQVTLDVDESMEIARSYGVEDKVKGIVGSWDDKSIDAFMDNPAVRSDLIEHVNSGVFDLVSERIAQNKITTPNFANASFIDQYKHSLAELNAERRAQAEHEKSTSEPTGTNENEKAMQEKRYQEKLEKQRKIDNEKRKNAASVGKRKKVTKSSKKFDPMSLEGEDLMKYVDTLIG